MKLRDYLDSSRSPRYAVLFAVPLLLGYEALALMLSQSDGGVRNGADVLLKWLFVSVGGHLGILVFNLVLFGVGAWLVVRDRRAHPGPLRINVFAAMLAESAVLALLVGIVVGRLTTAVLHSLILDPARLSTLSVPTQLMLSLGAGVYEELLFRVLLVGGLALLARRGFGWGSFGAGTFASVLGALLFSAFHYVGPYGDQFQAASFTFRALAGLVFSALYLTRGFGVTAWTHALYDIYVTLGP